MHETVFSLLLFTKNTPTKFLLRQSSEQFPGNTNKKREEMNSTNFKHIFTPHCHNTRSHSCANTA